MAEYERNFRRHLNLHGQEIRETNLETLDTPPANATVSRIWFDENEGRPFVETDVGPRGIALSDEVGSAGSTVLLEARVTAIEQCLQADHPQTILNILNG